MTATQPESDPDVAATVRLLHRRHSWSRAAAIGFIAFALAGGASSSAQSQGTPPPTWFGVLVLGLGGLTIAAIIAMIVDSVLLRRRSPAVRAQAAPLAAPRRRRSRVRHYPPSHPIAWAVGLVGMLLILVVAVVSVPAVFDGVAYLAGAGKTVTFDPVSHQTNCDQYGCSSSTTGILETGRAGVQATWPNVVPLGRSFQVREPLWRWGLGGALIDSDGIAVAAVLISLLVEGAAVVVVIRVIQLSRSRRRHRQQARSAAAG